MKKYQWLKGDNFREIEYVDCTIVEDGIDFTVFKSGRRVVTALIDEYLASEGDVRFIPDTDVPHQPKQQVSTYTPKSNSPTIDDLILKKLTNNKNFITLNVIIPVIDKNIYDIISESYEDYDLLSKLTDIIISKFVDKENLKQQCKEQLESMYSTNTKPKDEIMFLKTELVKKN